MSNRSEMKTYALIRDNKPALYTQAVSREKAISNFAYQSKIITNDIITQYPTIEIITNGIIAQYPTIDPRKVIELAGDPPKHSDEKYHQYSFCIENDNKLVGIM